MTPAWAVAGAPFACVSSVQTDRGAAHQTCEAAANASDCMEFFIGITPFFQLGHTRCVLDVDNCYVDRREWREDAGFTWLCFTLCAARLSATHRKSYTEMWKNHQLLEASWQLSEKHRNGNTNLSFAQSLKHPLSRGGYSL